VVTGTFGKALGGASGGFVAGRRELVDIVRACSRPYLFSNALAPAIAAASVAALELVERLPALRRNLVDNTAYLREQALAAGLAVLPGEHPIVPVMAYDEDRARQLQRSLAERGLLATALAYPVVPRGEARVRLQVSGAHTPSHLDRAVRALVDAGAV
jgi:glycine C-acetyltransferase